MRIAVLGAKGQLGRDLCPRLPGEVLPLGRDRADLTRPETLRAAVAELRPDVVINCAAYNFVDRAETEAESAFATNVWGVRELALACRDRSCLLVHFSTDYVFGLDESRETPYTEADPPGPVSLYGLSKLTGEYLVRSLAPRHIVIRTCGLYGVWGSGGKGTNFVETMLRLAGQGKPLKVVADQICSPSYTVDIAERTVELLKKNGSGLYHVTNAGGCSWFQFASTIFALTGTLADLKPTTSQEYGAPARRPSFSVLRSVAAEGQGLAPLRPWQEALGAYLEERKTARKASS